MENRKKILLITKSGWPGVVNYFRNVKREIDNNYSNIDCEYLELNHHSSSHSNVIRRLKTEKIDSIMFGGWDATIKLLVLNSSPDSKKILKWCSPVTQTELGGELNYFSEAMTFMSNGKLNNIALGLETDVDCLEKLHGSFTHLPIFMETNELDSVVQDDSCRKEGLNCDMFCAPNLRKNILAQFFALSSNPKVTLHINYGSNANVSYPAIAANVLGKVVNHGWIPRQKYLSTIKSMDFAMQVTLSESFNYAAAEHMYMGVPVICSEALPFARDTKEIKDIVIRRPEDLSEIRNSINKICEDDIFRKEMGEASKEVFIKYNNKSKKAFGEWLENNI